MVLGGSDGRTTAHSSSSGSMHEEVLEDAEGSSKPNNWLVTVWTSYSLGFSLVVCCSLWSDFPPSILNVLVYKRRSLLIM